MGEFNAETGLLRGLKGSMELELGETEKRCDRLAVGVVVEGEKLERESLFNEFKSSRSSLEMELRLEFTPTPP